MVPVIYIGVIFGLFFLQFSGGERFSRSVGPLILQATRGTPSDDGSPAVRDLSLTFDGLGFTFAEESGLFVQTDDELIDLRIAGYDVRDDGFRLRFDRGYSVAFLIATDPVRELQIRLELPPDRTGIREISIPYTLSGTPVGVRAPLASFVAIEVEDQEYYFTAPPRALIDVENQRIVMTPDSADQAVRYIRAADGDPGRVTRWFEDEAVAIGSAAYETTIRRYIDAAYHGWASGRYDSARVAWRKPGGVTRFTEEALTAYLAEAWVRGEYDRAFGEMRRAVDLHPGGLGLLSSTFLGNLRQVRTVFLEEDRARAARVAELVAAEDATVFRMPGLFRFAADRGSEALYSQLLELAGGLDLRQLDPETALGVLRNVYLESPPDQRAEQLRPTFADLVEPIILSSIVRAADGFYLQTSPGQVDVAQSVLAGAILDALGTERADPTIVSAGRNLVTAALARADANGILPAALLVHGDVAETGGGQVAPETLYPILVSNTAYPRQLSLYRELGSGHWIWTSVDITPERLDDSEWRFSLTYPRLRTHYLIFQGVPPFGRMELFGQTWRDAPDFEIYSKGRHYSAQSNTLMIKYYDDSVQRRISLFF